MNILTQAKEFYEQLGMDMFKDITMYMSYGYVFKTPDSLLMGKAVRIDLDQHPQDQWQVKNQSLKKIKRDNRRLKINLKIVWCF